MIIQKRLINTFLELVVIDSTSGNEKTVTNIIAKKLQSLGGKIQFDTYGNLIAKFDGTGKPLILNAHMDTVEPGKNIKPQLKANRITSDGNTILGGDPKAGIAIILETLASLQDKKLVHVPLEIVFTVEEELGLQGATNLDYSLLSAKRGITFDGEGKVSNVFISAPGYNKVDVTITGKAAHAGIEPEKGISAIKIAAEIISQLEMGRIDDETTANIGLINGGSTRNAVPEHTQFAAEIRSRNLKKLEKLSLHFNTVFKTVMSKYPTAKGEIIIKKIFNPFLFTKKNKTLQLVCKSLKDNGMKPNLKKSGGGFDVNVFHSHNLEVICVGTGVYQLHTTREYVKIKEFTQAALFCEQLIING